MSNKFISKEEVIFVLKNWCPKDKHEPKDASGNKLYFLNVGLGKDISIKNLQS